MEDFELLTLLAKRDPAAARRLVESAVHGFTDYVRDEDAFRAIRLKLLEALER